MACAAMAVCSPLAADAQIVAADSVMQHAKGSRLSVGGYGEVAYSRNFYSDSGNRYSSAKLHKNDPSHGRFDIPHAVIYLGYDFGKGWTLCTEIEFEHGGTGSAIEYEAEESIEFEQEQERGGEVELEQFWIQKSFGRFANIRAGHIVVPVGLTNAYHEPLNFFTVYRPEGENTILPCTWHQTGVSFWGHAGDFRYELQMIAGLDAWQFSRDNWIKPGTENTGVYADGGNGKPMVKRFTYALTRATLQDGPGANAIWNITNVTRPDRPKLYTTNAWAAAMAEDKEVIEKIKNDPTSPFWASTDDEISKRVNGLLQPGTNQFSNEWHNFEPEMSADHFYEFMVWHRGLAIPRARNLNDARVQQGKKVFMEIGCASCHRPSWKTGSDNYWTPNMIAGKKLPRYANQTIYPYSDMMQHKLYMVNDIHGSWCRTTPLWGRGLAAINGSGVERLHDCRARNEVEAIMWHAYSKNSHAYNSALKFYNLSKADRDAVVMFLRSI